VVDLQRNTPATSVDSFSQRPETRDHLVAVRAEHLRMCLALWTYKGMSGNDQADATLGQPVQQGSKRWRGPPNRLRGKSLRSCRTNQTVFQFQAADLDRRE